MARPPRLDFPGARHHVMNRVARKEPFFVHDAVCLLFLEVLAAVPERFGARIHGYALMPNHFHLMVEVPRGNLSQVMQFVSGRFTQAYNQLKGHDGAVFRGRYRNAVVDSDAYWMHLLAYLHLNPVAAGLATKPIDCLWTSHGAYVGQLRAPDWLTTDELLAMFGSAKHLVAYVDGVRKHRLQAPDEFDPERFWSEPRSTTAPRPSAPRRRTADEAIDDVARVLEIPAEEVTALKRGRSPNRAPWLAAWWLLLATGQSQTAVARVFGVSRGRVSQLNKQALELARTDEAFREAMSALEGSLRA